MAGENTAEPDRRRHRCFSQSGLRKLQVWLCRTRFQTVALNQHKDLRKFPNGTRITSIFFKLKLACGLLPVLCAQSIIFAHVAGAFEQHSSGHPEDRFACPCVDRYQQTKETNLKQRPRKELGHKSFIAHSLHSLKACRHQEPVPGPCIGCESWQDLATTHLAGSMNYHEVRVLVKPPRAWTKTR